MSNGAIIQSGTVMLSRSSKRILKSSSNFSGIAKLFSLSTPYGTP
ncbi:hypothetical protein T06_16190 [Trichinella sp. T6]|nr:hypothetical protein T06_16190 [Trichinella sp. T6]